MQNIEEEKSRAVEEAREEWITEHSMKDSQSDIEDQIAAARREWIKTHNDELERRLSNAIQEVRRIWDEEQKLKTKEVRNVFLSLTAGSLLCLSLAVVVYIAPFLTRRRRVFKLFHLSRVPVQILSLILSEYFS